MALVVLRRLAEKRDFASVLGQFDFNVAAADDGGNAERVRAQLVSEDYFSTLGTPALYGRVLIPEDQHDRSGTPPVVLSYPYWKRHYHEDPGAVGRTLLLQGRRCLIVGVMPRLLTAFRSRPAPMCAVGGSNISQCIGAVWKGGLVVGFGFMGAERTLSKLVMFANLFIGARLRGRRGAFYGVTKLYRQDPRPLREDLPKIFSLLAGKKIDPLVSRTFPLLDARRALELLAAGSVEGKIVLVND